MLVSAVVLHPVAHPTLNCNLLLTSPSQVLRPDRVAHMDLMKAVTVIAVLAGLGNVLASKPLPFTLDTTHKTTNT